MSMPGRMSALLNSGVHLTRQQVRFAPQKRPFPQGRFLARSRHAFRLEQISAYDFIDESNPVRAIDVFFDALDLAEMSFEGGAGGDWSAIVPPLVCLPSGISMLRGHDDQLPAPAFHGHTLSRASNTSHGHE